MLARLSRVLRSAQDPEFPIPVTDPRGQTAPSTALYPDPALSSPPETVQQNCSTPDLGNLISSVDEIESNGETPIITVCSGDLPLGKIFRDLPDAKDAFQAIAGCPVKMSSTHEGKYVVFMCSRSGNYKKKDSQASVEYQRKCKSSKCNCSFSVSLKRTGELT
jgi:hypothetical protein